MTMDTALSQIFRPCELLLPNTDAPEVWGAVACDQYTSEPHYWRRVAELTKGKPSAAHLILPELYLEEPDVAERIEAIHRTMEDYLRRGVLAPGGEGFIYVERTLADGRLRRGLVGAVDLEAYDYRPGAQTPIRATEKTVTERIPPRLMVRQGAPVELPHVLLLADDREHELIEPFEKEKRSLKLLYDFPLMQGGGRVRGYLADEAGRRRVADALGRLADPERFGRLYGARGRPPLVIAVGDGNHSLAAAKESYEGLKAAMPAEKALRHPARYAMAELVNLQDDSLVFEPIHRVLFGAEPQKLLAALRRSVCAGDEDCGQRFECVSAGGRETIAVSSPSSKLTVGTLQAFLDDYTAANGGRIDYIHGREVVETHARKPGNIGFLLPPMEKNQLFETVIADGVLPRKTFSMGHAADKRFYLEARRIR